MSAMSPFVIRRVFQRPSRGGGYSRSPWQFRVGGQQGCTLLGYLINQCVNQLRIRSSRSTSSQGSPLRESPWLERG